VFFKGEEIVAPFPVLFRLLVDEKIRVLLCDFGDCYYDLFGFAAVFFSFGS